MNTGKLADQYAVTDPDRAHLVTVRHGCHPAQPFVCLTCHKNDCKHIDAVETLIAAGGGPTHETSATLAAS